MLNEQISYILSDVFKHICHYLKNKKYICLYLDIIYSIFLT